MGKSFKDQLLDRWQVWSELTDIMSVGESQNSASILACSPLFASYRVQLINAGYIKQEGTRRYTTYQLMKPCPIRYNDEFGTLPSELEADIKKISAHKIEERPVSEVHEEVKFPSWLKHKQEMDNAAEIDSLKDEVRKLTETVRSLSYSSISQQKEIGELHTQIEKQQVIIEAAKNFIQVLMQ